jgi:acyl-CoA synthetase (AMP-forming)/AMP-acid ligase II
MQSWTRRSLFIDPKLASARKMLATRWQRAGLHDDETLPAALERAAREHPELFIVFHSETRPGRLDMASLRERSTRVAAALGARGIGVGDVVAVQLPNWEEAAIAYHAIAMLGAIFVPIVHIYGPRETDWIVRASGARLFISPDRWGNLDFLERAARMPALDEIERVVVGEEVPIGTTDWRELESPETGSFAPPPIEADAPVLVVYTSGTTSDPKGVLHSHQTLMAELRALPWARADEPHRVCLQPWPAGHIGGLCALLGPLGTGRPMVLVDRWDVRRVAVLIEEHGVDCVSAAPIHIAGLLDLVESGTFHCSSLESIMSGGAGVPPSLVERAAAAGWQMSRSYGSSEHPTATASPFDAPLEARAQTDGPALPNTEIRIAGRGDQDLPTGEAGEVLLCGPEQFLGYTDPALNADAFTEEGWFRTGDVGFIDTDGNLTITDRIKDIIIRGGENLSSLEIEGLLTRHPAIAEAAAVAMPDPRYGERVCAFLVLTTGSEAPDLADLVQHFDALGAARQKTPERIEILEEFPRTPSGKVKKHELRARLAASEPSS